MSEAPRLMPLLERPATLAVFDVCDTLYADNTTFGFIRFLFGGRLLFRVADALVSHRLSPVFLAAAVVYRLTGRDMVRQAAVAWLRGRTAEQLRSGAEQYVADQLTDRAVAETHRRLRQHQVAGDRVVLVSASLDVVVAAIAAKLGVEWRATELGVAGGRCSGRIVRDLTGRKSGIAEALRGTGPGRARLVVYTDNLSDRDLVDAADRAVIVLPPRRSRAAWNGVNAEYIQL